MTPARLRLLGIGSVAFAAALGVLAGSADWHPGIPAAGGVSTAAPAVLALGLAALAVAGCLALAGRVLRRVLPALLALVGALTVVVAVAGLGAATTAWPWVAVAAGTLQLLAAVAVLATVRAWPPPGGRYTRTRVAADDPAGAWDALSQGEDPTLR